MSGGRCWVFRLLRYTGWCDLCGFGNMGFCGLVTGFVAVGFGGWYGLLVLVIYFEVLWFALLRFGAGCWFLGIRFGFWLGLVWVWWWLVWWWFRVRVWVLSVYLLFSVFGG